MSGRPTVTLLLSRLLKGSLQCSAVQSGSKCLLHLVRPWSKRGRVLTPALGASFWAGALQPLQPLQRTPQRPCDSQSQAARFGSVAFNAMLQARCSCLPLG